MVNVRRREFDFEVVEDDPSVFPAPSRAEDSTRPPRTVTFRLPPAHVWRVARNKLFVTVWALVGSARITALDDKNRESQAIVTGDDVWLFDLRLAHHIRAEGDGCVLCLTLVPSLNVDEALSLIRAVEPDMRAG